MRQFLGNNVTLAAIPSSEPATAAPVVTVERYAYDGQEILLQFDQQIVALRSQRLAAAIDLDHALGGGLVLNAPTTPDIATAPARNPTP